MFQVSEQDQLKISKWLAEEIYSDKNPKLARDAKGLPYEGAIGGGVTYSFTPTSLGVVFKVHAYDKILDLTEYDTW